MDVRSSPPDSIITQEQVAKYQELHDDIEESGHLLQFRDRHALAELALITCEMADLRKHIADNGVMMTVKGDRGEITKRNGSCDVLDKRIVAQQRLLKAFRMAPDYRPNKDGGSGPPKDTDDGFGEI